MSAEPETSKCENWGSVLPDTPPAEPPGNNQVYRSDDPSVKFIRSTAKATWFIFTATAVAASVGVAQWNILSRTLDEMKQTFTTERAYIFMNRVQRDKTRPLSTGDTITIGFKNFGKTPAVLHEISGICKYFAELPSSVLNSDVTVRLPMDLVVGSGEQAGSGQPHRNG